MVTDEAQVVTLRGHLLHVLRFANVMLPRRLFLENCLHCRII